MYGRLDMIKWMKSEGFPWDPLYALHVAARWGCLDVLKFLKEEGSLSDEDHVAEMAARGGYIPVLRWLWLVECQDEPWDEDKIRRLWDLAVTRARWSLLGYLRSLFPWLVA